MGRHPKFKYYDPKRGGSIKEAEMPQKFPGVPLIDKVTFVLLDALDKEDNRYRIWAGNSKDILHTIFFPMTIEGLQEALQAFEKLQKKTMRLKYDRSEMEFERLGLVKIKKPSVKRTEKRQGKLRNEIADMIGKNQIDLKTIHKIYDEELKKIEDKNKNND